MRLTKHSDFALRLLIYLGLGPAEGATLAEVAGRYGISEDHLKKVAGALARAGLVEAGRGRAGGLRLRRRPGEIGVGEVVRLMEGDLALVECFRPETNRCPIAGACRLQGVLGEALAAFLAVLDRYTLADLIGAGEELAGRLGLAIAAPGGVRGAGARGRLH